MSDPVEAFLRHVPSKIRQRRSLSLWAVSIRHKPNPTLPKQNRQARFSRTATCAWQRAIHSYSEAGSLQLVPQALTRDEIQRGHERQSPPLSINTTGPKASA